MQRTAPLSQAGIPLVLAVGLDYPLIWKDQNLRIIEADRKEEALSILLTEPASVLVLGPRLGVHSACELLFRCQAEYPTACTANIILGCGSGIDLLQPLVDDDRLFYLSRGSLPEAELRSLVLAGIRRFQAKQQAISDGSNEQAAPADRVLDFCTRLFFQTDLATACDLLVEAVQILVNADRARCVIYDEEKDTLWPANVGDNGNDAESPCSGLIGYVARTGEQVCLERSSGDSRCDSDADDPGGEPDARLLAGPMFANSGDVLAVVAAARSGESAPFSVEDARTLKLLTACAAPALSGILLQRRVRALLLDRVQSTLDRSEIFRHEALQHYAAQAEGEGEILHSSPAWLKQTHWLMVALLVCGFLWMLLATVHERASGPASVQAVHRMMAVAGSSGLIRSVVVAPGDHVRAGDLLVQFYDTVGATTLERVKQEVRSPSDGVVSDVRVRAGESVNAGDQIATIVDEAAGYELVAFLPGYYAPQLHPGMKIVLKVSGYPESHETFVIDHVGAEVIGPHEAAQYAGRESADAALQVSGPAVSVRARLSRRSFQAGDASYLFRDGMIGETEVIVHSEPLLVYLVPGLKGIFQE